MAIDPYMLDIAEKDVSSARLAELALPTLKTEYVRQVIPGKNGLSFLTVPEDFVLVGHSSGGDYNIREPSDYAKSVFLNLQRDAVRIGATPVAMADVIDARSTDLDFVNSVGIPLSDFALVNRVAILNGELAKYGAMMNCPCNISATMLSLLRRNSPYAQQLNRNFQVGDTNYFVLDSSGKYVWMNSDGTGTKPLINGRFGKFNSSVDDAFAMQADDKGKFGGGAIVSFNLLESNRLDFPFRPMMAYADNLAKKIGIHSVIQPEYVGDRLMGPHGETTVYNMSGTLVSLVDEDITAKMPRPKAGDSLIAIKGNGRSNGFTDRRNLVAEWLGNDWHLTPGGIWLGEFLTKPSIIFYPVFAELINKELASYVTHMSGGSFRDKLAKQLSKYGLYAEVGLQEGSVQLFKPDPREAAIAAQFKLRDAYTKFAMGNEGFIASSKPEAALKLLAENGLEARVLTSLEQRADGVNGLIFRASSGDIVDFTTKTA